MLILSFIGLFLIINSETMTGYVIKKALVYSELNLSYKKIEGGLLTGVYLEGINYNNEIKLDLFVRVNYIHLLNKTLYISKIGIKHLWVKEGLLHYKEGKGSPAVAAREIFLKKIKIKKFFLETEKMKYKDISAGKIKVHVNQFEYDLDKKIKANIFVRVKSNMADLDLSGKVDLPAAIKIKVKTKLRKNIKKYIDYKKLDIKRLPVIQNNITGNFKELKIETILKKAKLDYAGIHFNKENIKISSILNLEDFLLKSKIEAELKTDLGLAKLKGALDLYIKDIKTLKFNYKADILANKKYLEKYDLYIKDRSKLFINSAGSIKNMFMHVNLKKAKLNYLEEEIKIDNLTSKINFDFKKSKIEAKIDVKTETSFDNSETKGEINLIYKEGPFFTYKTTSKIGIKSEKIEALDNSLRIKKPYVFKMDLNGTLRGVEAKFTGTGESMYKEYIVGHKVLDSRSYLNFKEMILKNKIKLELTESKNKINNNLNLEIDLNNFDFIYLLKSYIYLDKRKIDLKVEGINDKFKSFIKTKDIDIILTGKQDKIEYKTKIKDFLYKENKISSTVYGSLTRKDGYLLKLNSNKIKINNTSANNINLDIKYKEKRIDINTFNFEIKGLNKNVDKKYSLKNGHINLGEKNTFSFKFKDLLEVNGYEKNGNALVKIKTKEIPIEDSEYGDCKIISEINIKREEGNVSIDGEVLLKNLKIVYNPGFTGIDEDNDIKIVSKAKILQIKEERDNLNLDINIKTKGKGQYILNKSKIGFIVDLNIKKETQGPALIKGRIKKIDGVYYVQGKEINVFDSSIVFNSLRDMNPSLDIKAKHKIKDVIIYIFITGHRSDPKIKFTSEPTMKQSDIFSYLVLGRSIKERDLEKDKESNNAAALFLGNALTEDIAEELGFDKIELSETDEGKFTVEVGTKITDEVLISVSNNGDSASLKLEYIVNENISIETESTKDSNSIDIFYKKRY